MSTWMMRRMALTPANVQYPPFSFSICNLQSTICISRLMPQFIYTMKGLGKVHPPDSKVLEDIWLSFYFGAKIGVLGLNGAGKSSLLRIMSGTDTSFLGEAFPAEGISIG